MKKFTLLLSAMLFSVMSFAATVTFTPGEFDPLEASKFDVVKEGVTLSCSSGTITADQFRFFKSQTLTISSTAGNITSIEITCTANDDAKHGPGSFGELAGYSYSGKVGTWTGSESSVTFSTTNNQVRATQVVVTIDGEGGGETPDTPDTPDAPEEPVVGSIDGYTKVTSAASLVAGDKVVLYCDDSAVGVTGWSGNKDATVAETGWVEYVVEMSDGGFYLKDGEQYISLTVKNTFKYAATGSICNVTAEGILYITLDGLDYLLYENGGQYYRMYTDKSSNSAYKPFYVYKAGAGSGENPGTPDTPDTPNTDMVVISGLQYADAYYYEYEGVKFYEIDLYKDYDIEADGYVYPELYIAIEATSKTALNGTYDLLYAGFWTSENDSVLIGEELATVTIKNTDNEGNYSFKGLFVGEDGKTYQFDEVVNVFAYDADAEYEEIELNEDGTDNPGTDNPGTDNPGTSTRTITFDADVDKGNAIEYVDGATGKAFTISKDGVTLTVSSGLLGKYNNELHYRIYKNETLTITSTVGNIVSVEFTCTANDDAKYGPGCFTVTGGEYNYSGAVGTWTGSANEVLFTASLNQVRASQIVVKVATGTGVEDVTTVVVPVKVMQNGQVMIMRGENVYNVVGVQVK